jgi:hypothetical protein
MPKPTDPEPNRSKEADQSARFPRPFGRLLDVPQIHIRQIVPANGGAGQRIQWVQAVTTIARISVLFFRATKFFAESVKSRLLQPSDSPGAASTINAKCVEVFFYNYMAQDRRVAPRSSPAQYPSIDNESKLNFYITWNYVRLSF